MRISLINIIFDGMIGTLKPSIGANMLRPHKSASPQKRNSNQRQRAAETNCSLAESGFGIRRFSLVRALIGGCSA